MLVSVLHVVCMSIIPLRKTTSKILIFEITSVISKPRWGKIILKNINTEQFFASMMLKKKKNGNRKILNRSYCQKNSCWEGSFEGGPLWHFFEQLTITSWPKLNWFYGNSFVSYNFPMIMCWLNILFLYSTSKFPWWTIIQIITYKVFKTSIKFKNQKTNKQKKPK